MGNPPRQVYVSDAHEERIQSLETKHTEIASSLTENAVRLEFLAVKIEQGLDSVVERVEKALDPISDRIGEIYTELKKHEVQLTELQADLEARRKVKRTAGKICLWVLAGLASATLGHFSHWIAAFFGAQ